MKRPDRTTLPSRLHIGALIAFATASVLLIPLEAFVPGLIVWGVALVLAWLTGDPLTRRNYSLLLGCILVLGFAPINTDLDTRHFATLGASFLAVVLVPYLYMKWKAPDEVDLGFWPREFSLRDIIYTCVSIPLAWGIIWVYFFHLTPEMPTHWLLPETYDADAVRMLTFGINFVGIWDELFFINTCYILLRPMYPAWMTNLGQAVVYTSVLYHMAFTGAGSVIVYLFALTQGTMYERSRVLLYVLIVHLIVDVFLVLAILQYYYPDRAITLF
ncbi:MAG: hypothetical protein IH969_05890 [Candidatus Krumholzibacteriota bacterium]|nr:hypothetical protein [Candidatus Krumholzibacteriota bacterium]